MHGYSSRDGMGAGGGARTRAQGIYVRLVGAGRDEDGDVRLAVRGVCALRRGLEACRRTGRLYGLCRTRLDDGKCGAHHVENMVTKRGKRGDWPCRSPGRGRLSADERLRVEGLLVHVVYRLEGKGPDRFVSFSSMLRRGVTMETVAATLMLRRGDRRGVCVPGSRAARGRDAVGRRLQRGRDGHGRNPAQRRHPARLLQGDDRMMRHSILDESKWSFRTNFWGRRPRRLASK